jgi:hypothetical protein
MAVRRGLVALLVTGVALSGCAYPAARPVLQAGFDGATLRGTVGSTQTAWQGEWWFEYRGGGANEIHSTSRHAISLQADTHVDVSESVSGLESLGEPIPGLQHVRAYASRICIESDSPAYGPLCSSDQSFLNGDYAILDGAGFNSGGFLGIPKVYAESEPDGAHPQGQVNIDFFAPQDQPDIVGPVTCVNATGGDRVGIGPAGDLATVGVDNQQGPDALLELHEKSGSGATDEYLQISDPPADLTHCPAPNPLVVSGHRFGLSGPGPDVANGP